MAMDRRKLDLREGGFTLAEVLIALTIFSIGILSITQMLMIGEKGVVGGHKSFTAVQIARSQMELLQGSIVSERLEETCSTGSTPTIECTYSIRKDIPAEGLTTLEVISAWYEGERKRQLVLTTLRFE